MPIIIKENLSLNKEFKKPDKNRTKKSLKYIYICGHECTCIYLYAHECMCRSSCRRDT